MKIHQTLLLILFTLRLQAQSITFGPTSVVAGIVSEADHYLHSSAREEVVRAQVANLRQQRPTATFFNLDGAHWALSQPMIPTASSGSIMNLAIDFYLQLDNFLN